MKRAIALLLSLTLAQVLVAGNGEMWIPDVRVAPLMQTHWGQANDTGYSNTGSPCFNRFTPDGAPCGCSAAVMAQVLLYWQYPANAPAGNYACSVGGSKTTLSIQPGAYDWANMPFDTRGGVSDAECVAIGKLTYDCALALHTMFGEKSSFAYSDFAFSILTETFGYKNAMGYCPITKDGIPFDEIKETIFASLDMGAPVMASLLATDGTGHQVLIDGYGFDGKTPYVHILFGWPASSEMTDCWYVLPNVSVNDDKHAFVRVDGIVYNIFPLDEGDVLSGRVLDEAGNPVAGVEVSVSGQKVLTDEKGIYAFLLPGGKTYTVVCGKVSKKVSLAKSKSADCNWANPLMPTFTFPGTCGNSWGNDLVLSSDPGPLPDDPQGDDPPVESELGSFNPAKQIKGDYPFCGALYDSDGVLCGTVTLNVGKPSKKKVSKVSGTVTLLDGKKYSVKSTSIDVNEKGPATASGIVIKKFATLDLTIGNKGFEARFVKTDGTELLAVSSDLKQGLPAGRVMFSVVGVPDAFDGAPVIAGTSADGQVISVSAKGKLDCGKAASIKYKKVTVKDPLTKKKSYSYELQGLDDPKKPNVSGLKLTYTPKTALLKGSFYIYTDVGTAEKPKLKKTTAKVTGFVVEGEGAGLAVAKFGKTTYSWHVTLR